MSLLVSLPPQPTDLLQPYAINLNGEKIKELIGWKPLFKLSKEVVGVTVQGFKREGESVDCDIELLNRG